MSSDDFAKVGDTVWVDEGDSVGCVEYRGIVEAIQSDGRLEVRVNSNPIGHGAATGSLRLADPTFMFVEVESG